MLENYYLFALIFRGCNGKFTILPLKKHKGCNSFFTWFIYYSKIV
jgi:hypothetical protein